MIAMLGALFGYLAPFLPKVFDFFQSKQDNSHELELMKLRMSQASQDHSWRMEEINARADIEEVKVLRSPEESYASNLIAGFDKSGLPGWIRSYLAVFGAHFDLYQRSVRPTIAYLMVAFYIGMKYTAFRIATDSGMNGVEAFNSIWNEFCDAMFAAVIAFYFGNRTLNKWNAK